MYVRNASSISGKVIVWGFVLAAAGLSAHDIVTLFERIGAPAPLSWLAPVFIDGVTWLGKLMRSRSLSSKTNQAGLVYLILGGGASLAANLAAGESLGMKLLGLLAVTGFILGEIALGLIEGREVASATKPAATRWQPTPEMKAAEETWRKANGYYGPKKTAQDRNAMTTKYRKRVLAEQAKQLAATGATP